MRGKKIRYTSKESSSIFTGTVKEIYKTGRFILNAYNERVEVILICDPDNENKYIFVEV